VSALIADHFEHALESVEAYRWHLRAGKAAQYANAPETAIWHFRKALSLQPPNAGPGEQIEIYERMGETMHSRAQFMDAQQAYQEMRRIAELADDPAAQARAWYHLAQVQDSNADHWGSLESARMVERLADSVGAASEAERATSLFMQGLAYYRLGRAEDAIRLGEAALAVSCALGVAGHRQMARSLNLLGAIHTMLGDQDRARAEREQALVLFRELGDLVWIGHSLNNLGEIARHRGDYAEALPLYQEALAIAEQIGNREGEAVYRCNLGGVLVRLGQYESAIAELRKALAVSETGYWVSEAYSSLAEALLCQEQVGESLQAGQEALRIGRQANAMRAMGIAWRVIGMIIARCGETVVIDGVARTPIDCFSESDRVLAAIGAETERQRTSLEWTNHSKKSPSP
jgi:tetratricopeptide (TPR) repeat protein